MQLSNLLVLAGALAVTAHPSGHAHREAHDKRAFFKAVHQAKTTPTPAAVNNVASTSSSTLNAAVAATGPSSTSSSTYKAFCSGSSKRATAAEIAYTGNLGSTYGCNMMEIDASIKDLYNYTLTLTNGASEAYQVVFFNKIGSDGAIDGFFKGKGEAVTLTLAAGESAVVAFEANTQGAAAFGPGTVPTTSLSQYAGTWIEFDLGNTSNNGWSGADCSSLVAADHSMDVYACEVCDSTGTCSTIKSDGSGTNAFTKGLNAADGLGINWDPSAGALHMTATIG